MAEENSQDNKPKKRERPNLGMTCTSTDCENDQHYFGTQKKGKCKTSVAEHSQSNTIIEEGTQYNISEPLSEHKRGCCCRCGVSRVNWLRLHSRNIQDVDYTVASLKYGCWQHSWLCKDIDLKAVNHARRKGFAGMQMAAEQKIRKSVCKAVLPGEPTFDGRQTPLRGNALYYAQHAMACCCRKCIELWHGIPQDRDLTDDEMIYFSNLIMVFIRERLPYLTEFGEKVPVIRREQNKQEYGNDNSDRHEQVLF